MCVAVADGVADVMVAIAMDGRQIQNIILRSSSRERDEADFSGGIQ